MEINPSEVTKILKEQIKKFGNKVEVTEVGQVLSVGDGIARIYGLDNVQGVDDNPFDFETVKKNIEEKLNPKYKNRFKIMLVPNITNISYGRGVGYKIEEVVLPEKIQRISATKIRDKMRKEGKLK